MGVPDDARSRTRMTRRTASSREAVRRREALVEEVVEVVEKVIEVAEEVVEVAEEVPGEGRSVRGGADV